jgi:hypothetical protein
VRVIKEKRKIHAGARGKRYRATVMINKVCSRNKPFSFFPYFPMAKEKVFLSKVRVVRGFSLIRSLK